MSSDCLEPCAGNGGLAWVGRSPFGTADVIFWNGLTAAALYPDYAPGVPYSTREQWSAANPSLWGCDVAFSGRWGLSPQQIFYWHNEIVHRITYDQRSNINPSLCGGAIAWQSRASDADDWEILCWDGYGVRAITENTVDDTDPSLFERTLAWCSGDTVVYVKIPPGVYWESPPTPVVVGTGEEPCLGKNQIAYHAWDGHDNEIFLYSVDMQQTIQLTDNDYNDTSPSLFDGTVAWEALVGGDLEIFYWDGSKIYQLTDNELDDKDPSLSGTGLNTTIAYLEDYSPSVWIQGGYVIRARPAVTVSASPALGEFTLTWPSMEGRTYRVEYSDDFVNWKVAAESVSSAGYGETSWTDGPASGTLPSPSEVPQRFYRVCEHDQSP